MPLLLPAVSSEGMFVQYSLFKRQGRDLEEYKEDG